MTVLLPQISIKPWESSMVEVIAHAITAADLGVVVTSDSAMVRVDIPQGPGRSR